jgi:putative endopeptidase
MPAPFGDSPLTIEGNDPHNADRQALSQNVQTMAMRDAQQAAPSSKWDKFVVTTEEGIKEIPAGLVHTLQNPAGLIENAAISVGLGAASKILLPEAGPLGKLAAVGLGLYFAEQTAVPIYQAYKIGLNAKTMADIHTAGSQIGDSLGGLAINLPIGIVGYKMGAGIGQSIIASPKMAGFVEYKAGIVNPINDALTSGIQSTKATFATFLGRDAATVAKSDVLKGRVEVTDTPSGLDVSHMDRSVNPGENMYRNANGKWEDATTIPADKNSWGAANEMAERADKSVHGILEEAAHDTTAKSGSNTQKMGDFYTAGMDEAKIEAAGAKPLAPSLAKIEGIKNFSDLTNVVADMHGTGSDAMFNFGGALDPANSSEMIATATQGGLSMSRDYYVGDDARAVQLRGGLESHVQKIFALLGDDANTAKAQAGQVMNVESQLAKITLPDEAVRDPISTYNKMSVAELQKLTPNFDWSNYLKGMKAEHVTEVNVTTPDYFKGQNDLLANIPLEDWKAYLRFHQANAAAPYLSSDFVNAHFDFFGKQLRGTETLAPRWNRVVGAANENLGEAVGEKYVQQNFSPEAKAKVIDLVGKIQDAMRDALHDADMSAETRAAALEKIDKMTVKIGYPDKFKDYSALHIDQESYLGNVIRGKQFAVQDNIAKIGQPVDRSVWGMNPQTVNAYYDPSMNEVVFPAAILQPPYFDLAADDAVNLGSIGATIGHEITHGFDDQGSQYDAAGNLRKWWTPQDFENFMKSIQKIRDQYSGYTIPGGAHVKGDNVSGEAAADLGGANIAFAALQKILGDSPRLPDANGFTPEQRFFIAFAQSFATKYRPEALAAQVAGDEHPPDMFRVNGTVGNMGSFAKAFNLPDNAPIMVPAAKRTHLWEVQPKK